MNVKYESACIYMIHIYNMHIKPVTVNVTNIYIYNPRSGIRIPLQSLKLQIAPVLSEEFFDIQATIER